jgi:hypothetical protein
MSPRGLKAGKLTTFVRSRARRISTAGVPVSKVEGGHAIIIPLTSPAFVSQLSSIAANGEPLTNLDESKIAYAVIRHNVRTYESGGVVDVIRGRQNAEMMMKQFEGGQSSEDRQAGWRYFLEKTTLKVGTNAAEATRLRQSDLEVRESKALEDESKALLEMHPTNGRALPR